jgi:DNA-binding transcriptional ArsR family regulator
MSSPRRNQRSAAQSRSGSAATRRSQASLFAALGDPTRLALIARLSQGEPHSIAQLTAGSKLTRQAITKHLRVMERAKIVRCTNSGRETIFTFNPKPVLALSEYLALVSSQWDQALMRLQSFVESQPPE